MVAWAVLNLPLALLSPQAWTAPARGWWDAEPGYGSLLMVPRLAADEQVPGVRGLSATQASAVGAKPGARSCRFTRPRERSSETRRSTPHRRSERQPP